MSIDFSFAVVNWNTRDLLDACLASIYQVRGAFQIEILVADNASEDGSADMVRQKYPEVILVETGDNLGFARGHEPLFARSQGRYHVLVNSDVQLRPGCLEALDGCMRGDAEIGVLGCRLVDQAGRTQPGCRRFPNLWFQLLDASGLNRVFPRSRFWNGYKMGDFDHEHDRAVDQVMGSLFLIRRAVVDEVGALDTGFFMYYEEVDYCLRAKNKGWKVFYTASASVYHEGGGSSKAVRVATIRRTLRSMRRYYQKHVGGWTWVPLLMIMSLDLVTHLAHAALSRRDVGQTFKAYLLGIWDIARFRSAGR